VTSKAAAEKVAKLRRLADDPRTPATEAASARREADRLSALHDLTASDLELGRKAAAYDDLVVELEKVVRNNPNLPVGIFGAEKVVTDVLRKLRDASDVDKAARLAKIVTVVQTASLFVGDAKIVVECKAVIGSVLKNHGL